MRNFTTLSAGLLFAVAGAPLVGGAAAAQAGSVVVVPGAEYEARGAKEAVLGSDYRNLWTTPVRVPYLDLKSFAGGLKPTEKGGGLQTKSLRFVAAGGREFAFRSVNKWPHLAREPALVGTPIGAIIQDQVSSIVPGAPVIAARLVEAVGLPHPTPVLVVMPDDPALGEFREEFAGMLGTIEERPDERDDERPGFGGFRRIISTERLLERVEEDREELVDQRALLTARLMDLVMGDWDRHLDQWRWGAVDRGDTRYWVPIPRDRDYAFVDYDGLFLRVGRFFVPNAVRFSEKIDNILGLTLNARELDRRFLTGLDRPTWDSVAAFVQQRLSDEVIEAAVRELPAELQGAGGPELTRLLKSRRDDLGRAAAEFYRMLATEVDIHASDQRDLALIERVDDRTLRVRLFELGEGGGPEGRAYFDRRFHPNETNEVRVYLHGGDDRAVVRGDVRESLMARVIGGGGDDVLVDSSVVRGERHETAFYDDRGDNRFERGRETVVDTREYREPERRQNLSGETFRDWGSMWTYLPFVSYQSTDGLIVGATPTFTRFGFRTQPYKYLVAARGAVGLSSGAVAAEVLGSFPRMNSRGGLNVLLRATQLDPIHFYGFGNDTEAARPSDFYVVRQNRVLATVMRYYGIPLLGRFSVGPVVKYTYTQVPEGTPFAREHRDDRGFGQVGAQGELLFDRRDEAFFPRRGALLQLGGAGYPGVWDADAAFGEAHATASAYLTPPVPLRPTLALRVGGKRVWGEFPIHEAAFLGGSATVRGFTFERFAGDALLFGNAEARFPLGEAKLLARGTLGALALADAGRVFVDGESAGDWHTAWGGGLWFSFRIRGNLLAFSGVYAHGEKGSVYLKLGAPF